MATHILNTSKELKDAITRVRYETLKTDVDDHEKRIRVIEEAVTKFNFLIYLTMGGGLLSMINLLAMLVLVAIQVLNAK